MRCDCARSLPVVKSRVGVEWAGCRPWLSILTRANNASRATAPGLLRDVRQAQAHAWAVLAPVLVAPCQSNAAEPDPRRRSLSNTPFISLSPSIGPLPPAAVMPSADIELDDLAQRRMRTETPQVQANLEQDAVPDSSQEEGVISSWAWGTAIV